VPIIRMRASGNRFLTSANASSVSCGAFFSTNRPTATNTGGAASGARGHLVAVKADDQRQVRSLAGVHRLGANMAELCQHDVPPGPVERGQVGARILLCRGVEAAQPPQEFTRWSGDPP
jgi:hypothetical protein